MLGDCFSPEENEQLTAALKSDAGKLETLRDAVAGLGTEASKRKLSFAVCLDTGNDLSGRYDKAGSGLKHGSGGAKPLHNGRTVEMQEFRHHGSQRDSGETRQLQHHAPRR
ncbi:MAG: hypothetical protein LBT46_10405 [Planctomycetaceae bacterium]|nr:hypothetical protein [Planctomycetaceae bacterium]